MTEKFFKYLQFEKRLSSNTLSSYRIDIKQFADYLSTTYEVANPSLASYAMIRSWIIELTESSVQPISINRKVAALRAFYKFLLREGIITTDPAARIMALKARKRLPSFLREKEMGSVLDSPATDLNDFEGMRDRLIIEMFYGTGMRLSELLGLKDSSFDGAQKIVRVLGKRNKERVIPYSSRLASMIHDYVAKRDELFAAPPTFFILSSGQPCYPMMVQRLVKRRMASADAERKSPHILRHTYATHLLDRGAEINAVKDLLGHSSLAATQVYTHNSMEKIKKTFNQAHPKA